MHEPSRSVLTLRDGESVGSELSWSLRGYLFSTSALWSPLIRRSRENPWLSFSGNCASLLFFRAVIIGCNSYLLYKCPVPSCSCAVAEIASECSGLARLLNIVNERRSRIQEDLMRLFVLDNCADVYLSFSSPYLALHWLFECAPRPKREKNILMLFFLLRKKHFHFTIK